MAKIYVSYRREDSAYAAQAIYNKLVESYGEDSVFFDIDTVSPSTDFVGHLKEQMSDCDVLLAVIGDSWLTSQSQDGRSRLDDPQDPVRVEIQAALEQDIPVIPVLVGRVRMPSAKELPSELKQLSYRNAAQLRAGRDFLATLEHLIGNLEQVLERAPETRQAEKTSPTRNSFTQRPKGATDSGAGENEGNEPPDFDVPGGGESRHEAKMLIVGQGGVGKTSLVNRLVRDEFDPNEQKTEGINVESLSVETDGGAVSLRVWDFGGQEIMHATHQFFLTKRSLYLLVIDARGGEQPDILHYWIRIVESYAADSPVLVVVNKCDAHQLDLDARRLQLDYGPNLKGICYVSCATRAGIEGLRHELQRLVESLPNILDEAPVGFVALKTELERQAKQHDFIAEEEYRDLCLRHSVVSRPDQDKLLRAFHDLGIILHYNDPNQVYQIHDTKVLNPSWVTGGVYRVLNSAELLRAGDGILELAALDRILDDSEHYPSHRHRFLLGMMQKFELCFEFPNNSGRFLVPELLSVNEPDIGWRANDVLNFQYEYSVLPRGLVPRLIVRTHHLLTESPTYWRNGTVLAIEGCRVLIRGNLREERVFIQVQGPATDGTEYRGDRIAGAARRRALAVVRDYFSTIHVGIPRLRAKAKIPLADDPEAPPVDYEYLLELERDGVRELRFEGASRIHTVRDLLQGVDERGFDVFLSHNSEDKPVVRELAKLLRTRGIRPWLDEERLTPGRVWQEEMAEALNACTTVAVLLGRAGFGDWEKEETYVALNDATDRKKFVIPVLMPGHEEPPEVPHIWSFLKTRTWVDLSDGLDSEPFGRLVDAIVG